MKNIAIEPNSADFDIFISTPMSSFATQKEYHLHRESVNQFYKELNEKLRKKCYFAGKDITQQKFSENPTMASSKDLSAIEKSRIFLMILPGKLYSSALVEAGFALALNIHSIYFIKSMDDLPFLLKEAPQCNKRKVEIHTYNTFSEIYSIVKRRMETMSFA